MESVGRASVAQAIQGQSLQQQVQQVSVMPQVTLPNTGPYPLQKDTTFTKLFVGGLPYHTTNESLRKHFEDYGDIEEAVVITDKLTEKRKGYGFVSLYFAYVSHSLFYIILQSTTCSLDLVKVKIIFGGIICFCFRPTQLCSCTSC
jgi:hypothetical protein